MKKVLTGWLWSWNIFEWRADKIAKVYDYDTVKLVRNYYGPICIWTRFEDTERRKNWGLNDF